ncbi:MULTISPECIES: extradiol ring-cleavage dioxygenase [Marinobacterium]|uniref:Protocatechuate 4,5-dioxygenase, alpha chain n=2 Tax=Marinobacterium TaxID=48075 RepID=A0A1H6BZA0_9GAMM|nr:MULTISPECIES: extradiol ring-cleavage dioxygenase [Marinobacterium]TCK04283.1 protocatechuate 4,5-dioxygenase alpha chain [Marinobacterium mangrovicola]SEG66031.1 protocatechuate 4,5-dioxygenase, alpha chain [Marinobacterium lutimaris]
MKRDVLERVLWSLSIDRFSKEKFKENPEKFLGRFPLDAEDVRMILEFDVKKLQEVGVNPMLTMGYWIEMSPDRQMSSYNKKLGSESEYSASIKG